MDVLTFAAHGNDTGEKAASRYSYATTDIFALMGILTLALSIRAHGRAIVLFSTIDGSDPPAYGRAHGPCAFCKESRRALEAYRRGLCAIEGAPEKESPTRDC